MAMTSIGETNGTNGEHTEIEDARASAEESSAGQGGGGGGCGHGGHGGRGGGGGEVKKLIRNLYFSLQSLFFCIFSSVWAKLLSPAPFTPSNTVWVSFRTRLLISDCGPCLWPTQVLPVTNCRVYLL